MIKKTNKENDKDIKSPLSVDELAAQTAKIKGSTEKTSEKIKKETSSSVKKPMPEAKTKTSIKEEAPKGLKKKNPNWAARILSVLIIFIGGSIAAIYFLPHIEQRMPIVTQWLQKDVMIAGNSKETLENLESKIARQQSEIEVFRQKMTDQNTALSAFKETLSDHSLKLSLPAQENSANPMPVLSIDQGELRQEITKNIADSITPKIDILEEKINAISTALQQRIESLKARLHEEEKNSEGSQAQTARIDMLFTRIASIEAAFVPLSRDLNEASKAKGEREETARTNILQKKKLHDLTDRLLKLEAFAARDNTGNLLQIRLFAVKEKIALGEEYKAELESFKEIAIQGSLGGRNDFQSAVTWLEIQAQKGVLSSYDLGRDFNALIPSLINAKKDTSDQGFLSNIYHSLTSLFSLRRTDGLGELDGLIRQVEISLKDHKVKRAISLTAKMPREVQKLLEPWKTSAQKTVDVGKRLKNIEQISLEASFSAAHSASAEISSPKKMGGLQ